MPTNSTLALCDLIKPHLKEGSRLFTSKSVVVAINGDQPISTQAEDIRMAVRQLITMHKYLTEVKP
jgi:hypothetical protein